MSELTVMTDSEQNTMTDKERKIMQTFGKIIPKMTESEKNYLLALGEGISIAKNGIENYLSVLHGKEVTESVAPAAEQESKNA